MNASVKRISQEVLVPDIGGGTNVEIIEISVQVGYNIEVNDALIILETDKATMEVPSPVAGIITRICVAQGDKVSEGSVILEIEAASEAPVQTDSAEVSTEEACIEEELSSKEFGIEEVTADKDDSLESVSPRSNETSKDVHFQTSASTANAAGISAVDKDSIAYASPSVRKLAYQLDINLNNVTGSGPKGRITKEDTHAYVKSLMQEDRTQIAAGGPLKDMLAWPQVDFTKFGPIQRQPISRLRKISAANLHRNWVSIPHVTNHEDADITELEAFRVELNQQHEKSGIKVTMVALLIKVVTAALKKFPEFNASLDGDDIILKDYFHIGFAADTPNGLVVPVLRDADKKGILQVAKEVSELAAKARDSKLSANDMSGGCISISSLGGIGGTYFTPIINAPEVAILGVAKARTELKWNGKEAMPRLILPMSLSWDHRALDGAQAGRFNAYLAALLADIRRIML